MAYDNSLKMAHKTKGSDPLT